MWRKRWRFAIACRDGEFSQPLFFLPKGVRDAPYFSRRIDQQHVETYSCAAPAGIFSQQDRRRAEQPGALSGLQGQRRAGQGLSRFHFNDREQAFLLGNRIDLARFGAHTTGQDCPAILFQRRAGSRFGIDAASVGEAAKLFPVRHVRLISRSVPLAARPCRMTGEESAPPDFVLFE